MEKTVDCIELSKYIIEKITKKGKGINHLKLQKLLYYIEAWHLVYADTPLIKENFEAWLHGPVVRKVWDHYKTHSIMLEELPVEKSNIKLSEEQEQIIDDVLDEYGDKTGYYLECLTHVEEPWQKARKKGENTFISKDDMKAFYSGLIDVKQK